MQIQIKRRWTEAAIFEGEFETLLLAVEEAVVKKTDLRGADLGDADLGGADLGGANLGDAYLGGADLGDAYLRGANLGDAYLGGANLRGANLGGAKGLDAWRTTPLMMLLDQPGPIWLYKLVDKNGEGPFNGGVRYVPGQSVECADANTDPLVECGAGINVATLDWCLREWREGYRVLIIEFTAEDIAAIPIGTDGKIRLKRCNVIGEKDISGLVAPAKKETADAAA